MPEYQHTYLDYNLICLTRTRAMRVKRLTLVKVLIPTAEQHGCRLFEPSAATATCSRTEIPILGARDLFLLYQLTQCPDWKCYPVMEWWTKLELRSSSSAPTPV